jgi:hypothetical protein
MTKMELAMTRLRSARGRGGVVLDRGQARAVAAEVERLAAELAAIRSRAATELARREGRWRDRSDTQVCHALRWAVFGAPWPAAEGGPSPSEPPPAEG